MPKIQIAKDFFEALAFFAPRNYNKPMKTLNKKYFGSTSQGEAHVFTLSSPKLIVRVCDFGAALVGVSLSDPRFRSKNLVLGYENAEGYEKGSSSVGAAVGRYAGRIGGAKFTLGGREYRLEKNDGENHLHGGFSKRLWSAEQTEKGVRFTLISPDGDEGFPGELRVSCLYEVEGSVLRLIYEAEAAAPTHLNLTNHSYFSIGGETAGEELLTVYADRFAELGEGSIPTGRLLPVSGTALDLNSPKRLKEILRSPLLEKTGGLDHSFILPAGGGMKTAAKLVSPETRLSLTCRTTQPTVHIYTGNFIHLDAAARFPKRGGVCFETQHLPDSPNKPEFPTTLLLPGEIFREVTEYEFAVE